MSGNSEYDWKTRPMRRSRAGRAVMSCPSRMIRPLSGAVRPATMRNRVVLPQPLGPSRQTKSLSPAWNDTPSSTVCPLQAFAMSSMRRCIPLVSPATDASARQLLEPGNECRALTRGSGEIARGQRRDEMGRQALPKLFVRGFAAWCGYDFLETAIQRGGIGRGRPAEKALCIGDVDGALHHGRAFEFVARAIGWNHHGHRVALANRLHRGERERDTDREFADARQFARRRPGERFLADIARDVGDQAHAFGVAAGIR